MPYKMTMKCHLCDSDNEWKIDGVNIVEFVCTECGEYIGRSNGRAISFAKEVPTHHYYEVVQEYGEITVNVSGGTTASSGTHAHDLTSDHFRSNVNQWRTSAQR